MPLTFTGNFRAHAQGILALLVHPDGRTLLTACKDVVRWWDLDGGELARELRLGTSQGPPIRAAAFSPDAARLLVCRGRPEDARAVMEVRHLASSARELSVHRSFPVGSVPALALHPDGHRAALGVPGRLDVVDLASGSASNRASAEAAAFTPEGGRLVALERGRGRLHRSQLVVSEIDGSSPPRTALVALDGLAMSVHTGGARVLLAGERLPEPSEPDALGLALATYRIDDATQVAVADVDVDVITALAFGPGPDGHVATDRVALGHADGNVTVGDWSAA